MFPSVNQFPTSKISGSYLLFPNSFSCRFCRRLHIQWDSIAVSIFAAVGVGAGGDSPPPPPLLPLPLSFPLPMQLHILNQWSVWTGNEMVGFLSHAFV